MIIIEDSSWIFEEGFPSAIPVSIVQKLGREAEITAYPETETIACEYEKLFKDDYFSDAAVAWLAEKITPVMAEKGYRPDKFTDRWLCDYEAVSANDINKAAILPNTVKVISPKKEKLKNGTTYPFDFECEDDDAYFCSVEAKKIVSVASINMYSEESKIREIAIETSLRRRNKGFAVSNVAALALYLIGLGYTVRYSCQRHNIASQKTAIRAGFSLIGKSHFCNYYA